MSDDRANDEIQRWERLEGDRSVFKTAWQDLANHLQPNRADYITDRTPGQRLMTFIYDSVPMWALESFAAGMHSLLTSPTLRWFVLKCENDRLNAMPDVSAWLDAVSDTMYRSYNSPRQNFASQSFQLYEDLGCIGTSAMAILESPTSGTLYSCRHMKECVIDQNDEDRTDTLIRSWEYTAKQAVQAWGNAAGESVVKALEKTPERKFRFVHSVRPRMQRDPQRADKMHMAWQSRYINVADKTTIGEGGFNEFPYAVPRFSVRTGEKYGRGYGWTALPDIKMLYEMKKTILKAAQKVVDPPLMVPDDGFMMPIKTVPGALIWYRAGQQQMIQPLKTEGEVQLGQVMLQALQQQILRIYHVDWMLMPTDPSDPASAGKGVTATFTLHQRDQQMQMMSPMLARMQSEFLGPLIDRDFALKWRQSVRMRFGPGSPFPPPPAALQRQPLRVEYVSPIAIAQRSSQLDSVMRLVQTQMQLMQADPTMPHVVDGEGVLRLAARDLNTPALALKSPQVLAAEQQAQAQAQEQINGHAQLQSLAKTAKDGSAAVASLAQVNQNGQMGRAA